MLNYLTVFIILFLLEVCYLKIAKNKKIIDKPNHRSAHVNPTIRGGGIILVPAILFFLFFFSVQKGDYLGFCLSVLPLALISFIDDLKPLTSKVRILVHILSFTIIFYSLGFFSQIDVYQVLLILFLYIFSLGFLNIYNFMDGINGITFLNALISYITFLFINEFISEFTNSDLLSILSIAMIIFGFFNFRKKPKCFAGDVGSITIGFTIIYFIFKLFLETKNYSVFLFLGVYLLDGGWTIFERILRRENIFEAHRRHLYQLFANEIKVSHLKISFIYFLIQLVFNIMALSLLKCNYNNVFLIAFIGIISSFFYLVIKKKVYKRVIKF